ncbi:MAG: 16S rRNA (guanine(966)-N(2))-methyltransferase RsmD [Kiritimatiellia bacterium]
MRITGGFLGNRQIEVPARGVRPTQDRVRQALFSSLAERVGEALFLDLCAGSGSVGIEAWSRGAAQVWWVEGHARTYSILKKNVEALCGPPASSGGVLRLFREEGLRFLRQESPETAFDLIFSDPPYGAEEAGRPWVAAALESVRMNRRLKPGGLFVMEQSTRESVWPAPGWQTPVSKGYGETALVYYRLETAL